MKLNFLVGDATKPTVTSPFWILHGCNNIGAWGSGFVIALNKTFGTDVGSPVEEYTRWFESDGTKFWMPPTLGDIQRVRVNKDDAVINMITQKGCGPVYVGRGKSAEEIGIPFRYEAFDECLRRVKYHAEHYASKHGDYPQLVSPRIGCGLALAQWDKVEEVILDVFGNIDITYNVYDLPPKSNNVLTNSLLVPKNYHM